jgi:hypothetical protein
MRKIVVPPLFQLFVLWIQLLVVVGSLYVLALQLNLQNNLDMYISLLIGLVVFIGFQKLYFSKVTTNLGYNKIFLIISSVIVATVYLFLIYLRLLNIEF